MEQRTTGFHGAIRGLDRTPRSAQFEGRFGRFFRSLEPAAFAPASLESLAEAMSADLEFEPDPDAADAEENQGISAGHTYLGQFIDHDLTFDPVSSLDRLNDPDALVDFRTPRFDLDCVYGRGPDDQPYLYRADGVRMLLGRRVSGNPDDPSARDVPRSPAVAGEPSRALIGDPRNDENVIVSQLHAAFLRFHNRMADVVPGAAFLDLQRLVRWHYQWVVLYDFLPTIVIKDVIDDVLPHVAKKTDPATDPPKLTVFKKPKNNAFIPVEFSVAAYRFGHSMIRPFYRLNTTLPKPLSIFPVDTTGVPNGDVIEAGESLRGFREFPNPWAIDWRLFFPQTGVKPVLAGARNRVQPAYKIDTSLVAPLTNLPGLAGPARLALRNLLRGSQMGLPSGQAVAAFMGGPVLGDDHLVVGKATEEDSKANRSVATVSPDFGGNAPLWFYILSEAQQQFKKDSTPIRLGPVGGRIVAETFVRLLLEDSQSFLNQAPRWKPFAEFRADNGEFRMADLLTQARLAVDPQS